MNMTRPTVSTPEVGAAPEPGPFRRIVCAVDGSRSSFEAVRQAGVLAGPGSTVELVAVTYEGGFARTPTALLTHKRAEQALHEAAEMLNHSGAEVVVRTVSGNPPWKILLAEANDADLLVIARHGHSRASGIAHGSNATNIIHRGRIPLLVAEEPPDERPFPGRILVAADGPSHPEDAVRVAGDIAAFAANTDITLLRIDWSRRAKRSEVAKAIAEVTELVGAEPVEILIGGTPHRRIPEYAEREGASLIVMGARGLTGVHALRSVSERVAHDARCSVLIVHR
jgi:nucleotide-binding universal stress UspA family protein